MDLSCHKGWEQQESGPQQPESCDKFGSAVDADDDRRHRANGSQENRRDERPPESIVNESSDRAGLRPLAVLAHIPKQAHGQSLRNNIGHERGHAQDRNEATVVDSSQDATHGQQAQIGGTYGEHPQPERTESKTCETCHHQARRPSATDRLRMGPDSIAASGGRRLDSLI